MANTIQLQRRIKTAQNVSKTTKAMQMIAASKLKKAQQAALSSRPYVENLTEITRNLTTKLDKQSLPAYMKPSEKEGKTLVIVISPDKGLCGGLNTNLTREILKRDSNRDIYITIGKRMEHTVAYLKNDLIAAFPFGNTIPSYELVYPLIKLIDQYFLEGKVTKVEILSTNFQTVFTQKPKRTQLLPILPQEGTIESTNNFQLFEPNLETLVPQLLQRYLEMIVYQEILESYLSEQSARMLSMQNATNNAKDIIEALKLEYNKQRQAKITSELLDMAGGAIN